MKFDEEKEAILLDESADPIDRASAISCLRSDGVRKHEDIVISLLDHECEDLRANALACLLRWRCYEYIPMAIDWIRNDPDFFLKAMLMDRLAIVALDLPEREDEIMSVILDRLENDPDRDTARSAYRSACILLGFRPNVDSETFDRERDVDWKLFERWRNKPTRRTNLLS